MQRGKISDASCLLRCLLKSADPTLWCLEGCFECVRNISKLTTNWSPRKVCVLVYLCLGGQWQPNAAVIQRDCRGSIRSRSAICAELLKDFFLLARKHLWCCWWNCTFQTLVLMPPCCCQWGRVFSVITEKSQKKQRWLAERTYKRIEDKTPGDRVIGYLSLWL